MKNFFKRLWLRRWFRGCAWTLITIFTVLILVRQYIGWTGSRRWAAMQEMLAREGETLDFRKVAPDPVPDDQNFCAIPALKDLASIPANDNDKSQQGLERLRLVHAALPDGSSGKAGTKPKLLPGAAYGKETDMAAWADWLRKDGSLATPDSGDPTRDVLAALSGDEALMDELAAGLSRPESQWTPQWKTRDLPEPLATIMIPHYQVTVKFVAMLALRSAAAAKAGDAAKADQSLLVATRINQANLNDPLLIATYVAAANSSAITGAVWELCDAHSGSAEDFRALQQELSRLDYQTALLQALRAEIASDASNVNWLKQTGDVRLRTELVNFIHQLGWQGFLITPHLMPGGWYDGNLAALEQWNFDYNVKPLRDGGFQALLTKQEELDHFMQDHAAHASINIGDLLARNLMVFMSPAIRRVAYVQNLVNEAIAACALERYHIEHNAYPDTLEAANRPGEKPIPLDVLTGKPMGYHKTADGRYALWCVSFSGVDHGGRRILDADHPEQTKFSDPGYAGDWVWDFPSG